MGGGSYDRDSFARYSRSKGVAYDSVTKKLSKSVTHQDIFKSRTVNTALNPKNVIRECCDSEEHPFTKPIILALDVTGSMGDAATEIASSMGVIMENLYNKVKDIQFMTMGIGDFAYDYGPLQVSQFESDTRINEQLDKIWFEFGGGGNSYESYTAAWKFGLDHTKLDCYDKRNTKATLITIGDETLNPMISGSRWREVVGDNVQGDIETKDLYEAASKKFNIYHIHVSHGYGRDDHYDSKCVHSFESVLGVQHVFQCNVDNIDQTITNIVLDSVNDSGSFVSDDTTTESIPQAIVNSGVNTNENGEITW